MDIAFDPKMTRMEEKQLANLITYLTALGFKGTKLEEELREKISLNLPAFKVHHDTTHGAEHMHFELQFNKDHQFNAYRLQEYKATYRGAVEINHMVINGTDTRELEAAMKKIDWQAYFDEGRETDDVFLKQLADLTMPRLVRLSEGESVEGRQIQQELMFKYWPRELYEIYKNPSAKDPAIHHDRSQTFTADEHSTCNTYLAFHILSGRLDDLYEKLLHLDMEGFPGKDVYDQLENMLSTNPKQFDITCFSWQPEGMVEFVIPVSLTERWYSTDGYTATLTMHPEIEHGIIGGIDSGKLEEKMAEINWKDDSELFIFHEDREPDFSPLVNEIDEQLHQLSQHATGAEIADRLKLKYHQGATFFEDRIPESAWRLTDALPKRRHFFMPEVPLRAAYNLLAGRGALSEVLDRTQAGSGKWVRLNLDAERPEGSYPVIDIKGPILNDLEEMLKMLPLAHHKHYYIKRMSQGDLTEVPLSNGTALKLEVSPEEKSLNLYTMDMRPVPFNFRLDPDWKPLEKGRNLRQANNRKLQPKHAPKTRKGKTL